jgi:hypothetical protein
LAYLAINFGCRFPACLPSVGKPAGYICI